MVFFIFFCSISINSPIVFVIRTQCLVCNHEFSGARTFPARSFPPDGTTFSQITLGQKLSKQIPPYSYWNMQFYQSEPAYVKFDYNIPRGASIGVYARRNALPTHTQYHFKEVLSGFNARTTRSTHVSIHSFCVSFIFLASDKSNFV